MRLRFLTGLMIVFVALYSTAKAQSPLEKLRLTYSAIGGSQASVWVPYEAGIFRKHGLDVELLYVGGGGRAAQVVQSGEVPISWTRWRRQIHESRTFVRSSLRTPAFSRNRKRRDFFNVYGNEDR
jgi:hypothetical protein